MTGESRERVPFFQREVLPADCVMDFVVRRQAAIAPVCVLLSAFLGLHFFAIWLPLNYALFDLYLLIRGGARRGSINRGSGAVRAVLRLSPRIMILTAFFLGYLGTEFHQAIW